MTSVDLAVLGVMFLSGLIAFVRGLVREVLSIAAWIGAAIVATTFLPAVRPLVTKWVPKPEWIDPVGLVGLFVISLIVFSLLAKVVGGAVRASPVSGVDRSLGLLFGLARGVGLAIAAYIVVGMAVPADHWPAEVLESRSLPYIYSGAKWVVRQIPQEYQPHIDPPPPARQTPVEGMFKPISSGRAIDAAPRR